MTSSNYEEIRLVEPTDDEDGQNRVIAYFAPTFEVVPRHGNDLFEAPLAGARPSVVRDNGLWTSEVTVQGTFQHSDNVPPAFREALLELFDAEEAVTPTDQINRLVEHVVYGDPGHYEFYHNENEYTATSADGVDVGNNVYPVVRVADLSVPEDGEASGLRADFEVQLVVGIGSGDAEVPET